MTASGSSGRAASCTSTTSASSGSSSTPARTESVRVAPPGTHACTFEQASSSARRIAGSSQPGGATMTIRSIQSDSSRRRSGSARSGSSPSFANAFGCSRPSLSPRPAATRIAQTLTRLRGGGDGLLLRRRLRLAVRPLGEDFLEPLGALVLVHVLRIHELGGEDLLRLHEHLLLAGRETLLVIAQREVAHDLGELEDIARLHLVPVVLEAAVPVFRHLGRAARERLEDDTHFLLADDAPQADLVGVFARDLHGHIVVQDLDRQVLALLAKDLTRFLLDNRPGTVVRVHHLVADLVQAGPPLSFVAAFPPKEPARRSPAQGRLLYQKTLGNATFWGISGVERPFYLELQVAVDQVVLLQPPEALPDLPGPYRTDTLDCLEIALRGPHDHVQRAEVADDAPDHGLGDARDVREHPVAARLNRCVEWARPARVAEKLDEAIDLEEILVAERPQRLEGERGLGIGGSGVVVPHDRVALLRHVADELLELEPDEPALASELHAVAPDALRHPRGHLGSLERHEDVVEDDRVLELERRQPRQHLLEPLPVGVEGAERLVRLREHVGHRVELVAARPDEDRHGLALLGDRDDERPRLFCDALRGAVAGA